MNKNHKFTFSGFKLSAGKKEQKKKNNFKLDFKLYSFSLLAF